MPGPYTYATLTDALNALSLRLNDLGFIHWTQDECTRYITEALRVWNCLTQVWVSEFTATYTSASQKWQSTSNISNAYIGLNGQSPRAQTLHDSDVYTLAQYHLLEPPTGSGTWTGTSQFALADFAQALERRRDVVLQEAATNVGPIANISLAPGENRINLPDTTAVSVLDIRRVRYIPYDANGNPILSSTRTLFRDDGLAMEYFDNQYLQTNTDPLAWDVISGPPLAITFDASPATPNQIEVLSILSGGLITPPTPSPLLIPDDYYWVLKFGMMADLLRKESESTDLARAEYCEQRYSEGIKLMQHMPWILQARINNVPVDTPSVSDADNFDNEWDSNPGAQPGIVIGGVDLFAMSPVPQFLTQPTSVTLSLVQNAPIPILGTDSIQISRDVLNVVLDEAEHLAQFKHGGSEFTNSMTLHENFIHFALDTNKRLRESGIFATTLRSNDSKQDESDPRFAVTQSQ